MHHKLALSAAGLAIVAIAIVYWPVLHAQFVWADLIDFQQHAWLRQGDEWKHYILRDFNYWTNYFRPLVVAFFTLQVRLFDTSPGPMHAVSLGLHLINTLLVGLLSWRLGNQAATRQSPWPPAGIMLFYGLHPVLIESVAWIGCQFDLIVTMLTLCGVLASTSRMGTAARATIVAILFFLAACSKESAVSFPLIVVIFDWLLLSDSAAAGGNRRSMRDAVRLLIHRNWPTYTAMLFAGFAYLGLRHWALGEITNPFSGHTPSVFGRLQEVCFLYLHYWRTMLWPMSGMSPIHLVDTTLFNTASAKSVLTDAAAIGIALTGFYLALRCVSITGCIIVAVTVALLPALHITPLDFDISLYHERYVMTALTVASVMLPRLLLRVSVIERLRRIGRPLLAVICLCWLLVAVFNIRATLPLWANNVNLWRWAHAMYPDSVTAKSNLLSAYIDINDRADANALVDQLQAQHVSCTYCMLNAATLAITERNPARAATALAAVKDSRELLTDKEAFRSYLLLTGQMLTLQGHLDDAEQVLRATISMDPLDPQAQLSLAVVLAHHGKKEQAIEVAKSAMPLIVPGKRDVAQKTLDRALEEGTRSTQLANQDLPAQ